MDYGKDKSLGLVYAVWYVDDQHLDDQLQVVLEIVSEQEWVERLYLENLLEHSGDI